MELLAVVEAEDKAEALVKEAQERKQQAIRDALQQRDEQLAKLKAPAVSTPNLKPLATNVEQLKGVAKRNKAKALKLILEELNAA